MRLQFTALSSETKQLNRRLTAARLSGRAAFSFPGKARHAGPPKIVRRLAQTPNRRGPGLRIAGRSSAASSAAPPDGSADRRRCARHPSRRSDNRQSSRRIPCAAIRSNAFRCARKTRQHRVRRGLRTVRADPHHNEQPEGPSRCRHGDKLAHSEVIRFTARLGCQRFFGGLPFPHQPLLQRAAVGLTTSRDLRLHV